LAKAIVIDFIETPAKAEGNSKLAIAWKNIVFFDNYE
jgi:hypothetical protein